MKRWLACLAVALLGWVALSGCGGEQIRSGDTVTPVLASQAHWVAGASNDFKVRLRATSSSGDARLVDFGGVPANVNPRATVTFYQGDAAQTPVEVTLDHRC
jgi:hypothetical protein